MFSEISSCPRGISRILGRGGVFWLLLAAGVLLVLFGLRVNVASATWVCDIEKSRTMDSSGRIRVT